MAQNDDAASPPKKAWPEWQNGRRYEAQDSVTYQGKQYTCLQAHTSNSGWTPEATSSVLWLLAQIG